VCPDQEAVHDGPMSNPTIWRFELLVETDDPDDVARLQHDIGLLACRHDAATEHACDVAWFLTVSPLDGERAEVWRPELNR
jgi:hypothetical protein